MKAKPKRIKRYYSRFMNYGKPRQIARLMVKKSDDRSVRPQIVCICGSSRFVDIAAVKAWEFEKRGIIALGMHLLPETYGTHMPDRHHFAEQEGVAPILDELHLLKIDMADSVFVVNKDGYIGERTAIEIAWAKNLGKPVEYMEPITTP